MHTIYLFSVWLHILAALVWIGSMAFLGLVLVPTLRERAFQSVSTDLLQRLGMRFRPVGWIALGLLIVTGVANVGLRFGWPAFHDAAFWGGPWGQTLAIKLGLVAVTLLMSAVHDFYVGPRAATLMTERPDAPDTLRMRSAARWMGRLTLLIALAILALAVTLPRGGLG